MSPSMGRLAAELAAQGSANELPYKAHLYGLKRLQKTVRSTL